MLRTILRLFRNYRPMAFFGAVAIVLAALSAIFMVPVLRTYFATGLVPNFPTLIVCGFTMLAAIHALFAGMQLQNAVQKNRQDFEMNLIRLQNTYEQKLFACYDEPAKRL